MASLFSNVCSQLERLFILKDGGEMLGLRLLDRVVLDDF